MIEISRELQKTLLLLRIDGVESLEIAKSATGAIGRSCFGFLFDKPIDHLHVHEFVTEHIKGRLGLHNLDELARSPKTLVTNHAFTPKAVKVLEELGFVVSPLAENRRSVTVADINEYLRHIGASERLPKPRVESYADTDDPFAVDLALRKVAAKGGISVMDNDPTHALASLVTTENLVDAEKDIKRSQKAIEDGSQTGGEAGTAAVTRKFDTGRSPNARMQGPVLVLGCLPELYREAVPYACERFLRTLPDDSTGARMRAALVVCVDYALVGLADSIGKAPARSLHLVVVNAAKGDNPANPLENTASKIAKEIGAKADVRSTKVGAAWHLEISFRKEYADHPDGLANPADDWADELLNALLSGNRPVARWRSSFLVGFADTEGSFRRGFRDALHKGNKDSEANFWKPLEPLSLKNSTSDEKEYFRPELRKWLFAPEGHDAVRILDEAKYPISFERRLEPGSCFLELGGGNYDPSAPKIASEANFSRRYEVSAARLHFSRQGIVTFEWEMRGKDEADFDNEAQKEIEATSFGFTETRKPVDFTTLSGTHNTLWRHYLQRPSAQPSFAEIIDLNAQARLVDFQYQSLTEDAANNFHPAYVTLLMRSGNDAPPEVKANLYLDPNRTMPKNGFRTGQVLSKMIQQLTGINLTSLGSVWQLTDDRARVVTSIVLEGGTTSKSLLIGSGKEAFEALFARVNVVDPYAENPPYDREFSRRELQTSTYARFLDFGSRLAATHHSFSFVCYRHHRRIAEKLPGDGIVHQPDFAERHIHTDHMRGIYKRIFQHFLQAELGLSYLGMRIALLEADMPLNGLAVPQKTRDQLLDLRLDLARLSNRLWQKNLSTQLQGRELTALMESQFALEAHWQIVDHKMQTLETVLDARHARRIEHALAALSVAGVPFLAWSFLNGLAASGATGSAPNQVLWHVLVGVETDFIRSWWTLPQNIAETVVVLAWTGLVVGVPTWLYVLGMPGWLKRLLKMP